MALLRLMVVKIVLIYLMSGCHNANGRCKAKGTCPPDWNQRGDHCYKAIDPRSWSEAREECVRIGGVMATPNSIEENSYLYSLCSKQFWINCFESVKGTFDCKDGMTDIHFSNWNDREPNGAGAEQCVESTNGWNDRTCDGINPAVCKQPVPYVWQ